MQKKVTALHLRLHENKKTHKVMRSRNLLGLVNRTKLYTVCTVVMETQEVTKIALVVTSKLSTRNQQL